MTVCPYDLIVGLDRSDQKADLCLIDVRSGSRRTAVVDTAPEALCEWLAQLRQQHPTARVGLEQPAVHLVPFLEAYAWITLHPINPLTLQKYREAFVTSRAKDDTKDAESLADLLLHHHAQLQLPDSPALSVSEVPSTELPRVCQREHFVESLGGGVLPATTHQRLCASPAVRALAFKWQRII